MLELFKSICIENKQILLVVVASVIADTVLGMVKAWRNSEFTFTSSGMRKCIPKCIEYITVLLLMMVVEFAFAVPAVKGVSIIIIATEFTSIKENIVAIPKLKQYIDKLLELINKGSE